MASAKLEGQLHWHACIKCRRVYSDTCKDLASDSRCDLCRGQYRHPLLVTSREPRECCYTKSRIVMKEEKAAHRLVGAASWYICATCSRCQGYNPERKRA